MITGIVLVWVACGVLGYVVGNHKGRGTEGLLLGLLLGVIGLVMIAFMKPTIPASGFDQSLASQGWGYLPPPQWFVDPSGRNEWRWWNGRAWTEHVWNGDQASIDPKSNAC
jgi:hypothetical protein